MRSEEARLKRVEPHHIALAFSIWVVVFHEPGASQAGQHPIYEAVSKHQRFNRAMHLDYQFWSSNNHPGRRLL
jgi:hypothetical protein